jgi:hypothetical protein
MKPWHDYSHTIASIAQSFVNVCHFAMTWEQIKGWSEGTVDPYDCLDVMPVLDRIIENHGILLWDSEGHLSDDALSFFNQCYEASENLNKKLAKSWFPHIAIKETA